MSTPDAARSMIACSCSFTAEGIRSGLSKEPATVEIEGSPSPSARYLRCWGRPSRPMLSQNSTVTPLGSVSVAFGGRLAAIRLTSSLPGGGSVFGQLFQVGLDLHHLILRQGTQGSLNGLLRVSLRAAGAERTENMVDLAIAETQVAESGTQPVASLAVLRRWGRSILMGLDHEDHGIRDLAGDLAPALSLDRVPDGDGRPIFEEPAQSAAEHSDLL